jgi:hypothetical protein
MASMAQPDDQACQRQQARLLYELHVHKPHQLMQHREAREELSV